MSTGKNKGFTLVELAIVLVIVGLLISGILVAQSMINTTRIQAFGRQIGQYDAAIANFQDKYKGLPGDSLQTYTTARTGIAVANNGIINPSATTLYDEEVAAEGYAGR
jgi:prepilin-type N-terminal cleavage/methylation domain-containing protein